MSRLLYLIIIILPGSHAPAFTQTLKECARVQDPRAAPQPKLPTLLWPIQTQLMLASVLSAVGQEVPE